MRVFVTGGTGFIGRRLIAALLADGDEVTVLTRSAAKAEQTFGARVTIVEGNPLAAGAWQGKIAGHDAIVNLCGEPILKKKWTPARKQVLLDSRLSPTRLVVEAIAGAEPRPEVLVSGSAVSYYGFQDDEPLTEESGHGTGFASQLVIDWEDEARRAEALGVRVVLLRTGIVLGKGGGALSQMVPPFKFFVGGPIGSGRQYFSWIHIADHVGLTKLALADKTITGGLNMTAPNPVSNRDFMKALGRALGRPSWLPVPGFILRAAFGEGAELLLKGQRVLPVKAQDAGYDFQFADLDAALRETLGV